MPLASLLIAALAADVPLAGADAGAVRTPSSPAAWGGERTRPLAVADYRIDAVLDPRAHTVDADEQLTWRNRSDVPIAAVYFHLYLNAFESEGSTFSVERARYGGFSRIAQDIKKGEWGYIELRSVEEDGTPLRWSYVHPDSGPESDHTVVRVDLARTVPPRGTAHLRIRFHDQLPRVVARTGYFDTFHLVAQWFPKIGVLELPGERGSTQVRWNCHEFHLLSEFYADFGAYDVSVTVPKGFAVAAVGERQGPAEDTPQGVRYRFVQDDVHDFAFAAWDKFETLSASYEGPPHVAVEVVYPREYVDAARVSLDATLLSLGYYSRTLGPYPYPHLTVVVPPFNAQEAGAMEYETFFTSVGAKAPLLRPFVRYAVIHEFGHGYFMGLLASNEGEEPFLDEGLNEFWGSRLGAETPVHFEPPALRRLGFPSFDASHWDLERLGGATRFPADPIAGNSWQRWSEVSYGIVYQRSAIALHDLEARLGKDVLARAFREYYRRWKFRHPSIADLRAALEDVSGDKQLVDRWFDEQVFAAETIDDRLESLASEEVLPRPGVYVRDGKRVELDGDAVQKEIREARESFRKQHPQAKPGGPGPFPFRTIVGARRYRGHLPQTLVVRFEDGKEERLRWDESERWHRWELERPVRGASAQLDPDREILLDVQKLDDGRLREPQPLASRRWTLEVAAWTQAFFAALEAL
jgi:hypothetical protein